MSISAQPLTPTKQSDVQMSYNLATDASGSEPSVDVSKMSLFERYLTLWVFLAMVVGVLIGYYVPSIPEGLDKATISDVSVPIAVLLWGIILPMMIKIEFASIVDCLKQPKAILLTCTVNYVIQPFTMYGIAVLFFRTFFGGYLGEEKADGYVVGSILLGGAPCTAMVFVWSILMKGNAAYTLTQVAVNNIILMVVYVPTAKLLAGGTSLEMPWSTLFVSVGIFVVIPLLAGYGIRKGLGHSEAGLDWLNSKLLPVLDSFSMVFLVLMIVLIFISQAATITDNVVDILVIAMPLILQTFLIWGITYTGALYLGLSYDVAGPATLIACSNFFEMAVAVAVSLYGSGSPAALATVVGVLIEVPLMLILVAINNKTQHKFASASAPLLPEP
ncbi:arsenical-resistance protein [Saprolegnia diclina VS20]|uniref:Arsenical-resistance protein n=1 Tax=Saprolegnia diclina (strain VS20) TaxID=1156394 RepID=T0QMI2_SAPDV|nr:arsenical-resistance protein [Saprolegnia diclina VS20]EQC35005.1 arsenical-resistance protein [Saprolegnia diclina VS20]|eukprot:XP_008611289.1 arsenical-resistance protein [Saprolegnia diclina VS20]